MRSNWNVPHMILILVALLVFGYFYNRLVAWVESGKQDRGYTAFLVVGGCLVTLIGGSLVAGLEMGVWYVFCFAASGLPMVLGSMDRSSKARCADEQKAATLAKELLHDAEEASGLHDQQGG